MPSHILSDRVPSLRSRTRFFDEAVLHAIAQGVPQIVIVGAGYDDRALRFRSPGVRFVEIDHPATQHDKAHRLAALDADDLVTLVPGDFVHDDVAQVLDGARHDLSLPSLFICEGLLAYLDQPTIVRLLGGLRTRAHPSSTLVASLAVHAAGIDTARFLAVAELAPARGRRRALAHDPPRGRAPGAAHAAGWYVERVVDQADTDATIVRDRSLLVRAAPDETFIPESAEYVVEPSRGRRNGC